jgi:hypothetical protein
VHRGDGSIKAQFIGQRRITSIFKRGFKGPVLAKDSGGAFRADAGRTGNLVRWVAPKRDEIRHLYRFDAVSSRHLLWTDANQFASAGGLNDRCSCGGELERMAIASRDDCGSTAFFFAGNGGGQEVIGLESWGLGGGKAAGDNEIRQGREVRDKLVVELPTGLISPKGPVSIRQRIKGTLRGTSR